MKGNAKIRVQLGKLITSVIENNWWVPELFEKNTLAKLPIELEIISLPPTEDLNYNCFIFVLGFQNDPLFIGNVGWNFTKNLDLVFNTAIAQNLFLQTHNPLKGDLIVYRTTNGSISHVGLVDEQSKIISKWSWGPVIRHHIWDVPIGYGERIFFSQSPKDSQKNKIVDLARSILEAR